MKRYVTARRPSHCDLISAHEKGLSEGKFCRTEMVGVGMVCCNCLPGVSISVTLRQHLCWAQKATGLMRTTFSVE